MKKQSFRTEFHFNLAKRNCQTRISSDLKNVKDSSIPKNRVYHDFLKVMETNLSHCKTMDDIFGVEQELDHEKRQFHASLPIYSKKSEIIEAISNESKRVTVLVAETGSGKSTQLTQYLLQTELVQNGIIACAQPRKVAAVTLARRVSEELQEKVGGLVGYQTGSQSVISSSSQIIYLTDSVLLRQSIKDHSLKKYSCVIVDEAHERTLFTDLLLGKLKSCLRERQDLKIVITSATINPHLFKNYFSEFGCNFIQVPGNIHPVSIRWSPKITDYSSKYLSYVVQKVAEICQFEPAGDILAFLTTPSETEQAERQLGSINLPGVQILQLHGQLQACDQEKVFNPPMKGFRKVIFATNAAETSITIPGICYVVDCGLVKERQFDIIRQTSSLVVKRICRSSAKQRLGRSGRTDHGTCYRLYTEEEYAGFDEYFVPEILRTNLGQAVLHLKVLGIDDPTDFDFIERPDDVSLHHAIKLLIELGALDANGKLTDVGRAMSKFSLDPRHSKLLLNASKLVTENADVFHCSIIMVSCLNTGDLFYRGSTEEQKSQAGAKKLEFCVEAGDAVTSLKLFLKWNNVPERKQNQWCVANCTNAKSMRVVRDTFNEMKKICVQLNLTTPNFHIPTDISDELIGYLNQLILSSFQKNLAVFTGHPKFGYYCPGLDSNLTIHPSSAISVCGTFPRWVTFEYVLQTSRPFIHHVTPVNEETFEICKVPNDLVKKASARILVPVDLEGIAGPRMKYMIRSRVNRVSLEEHITVYSGVPSCLSFQSNDQWERIQFYVKESFADETKCYMKNYLSDTYQKLKQETTEHQFNVGSRWRSLMGCGGEVTSILQAYEYVTVAVRNVDASLDNEMVVHLMSQFGRIIRYHKFNVKGDKPSSIWGTVTFDSASHAAQAVSTLSDKSCIYATPSSVGNFTHGSWSGTCQQHVLKLTWARRPSKPPGFVTVTDGISVLPVLSKLKQALMMPFGIGVKVHLNTKNLQEINQIVVHNFPVMEEEDFSNIIIANLPEELATCIHCSMARMKSFETPQTVLDEFHQRLVDVVKEVSQEEPKVKVLPPTNASRQFIAIMEFSDLVSGSEAKEHMQKINLSLGGGQTVQIDSTIKDSLFIKKEIYDVLSEQLDQCIIEVKETFPSATISSHSTESSTRINIQAKTMNTMRRIRAVFGSVLKGQVISCTGKERILLSKAGRAFLDDLQAISQIWINIRAFCHELILYGSLVKISFAKNEIQEFVKDQTVNKNGLSSLYHVPLSTPHGIMKALLLNYGFDLDQLTSFLGTGCQQLKLDVMKREIILAGTKEAFEKLTSVVIATGEKLDKNDEDVPECAACLSGTEPNAFCLELCGHYYCRECIEQQIKSSLDIDGSWPLVCAKDGCGESLSCSDLLRLNNEKLIDQTQLIEVATGRYLVNNHNLFTYCKTDGCNGLFKITDRPSVYRCDICDQKMCSARGCGLEAHPSQSCTDAKEHGSQLLNDDYFNSQWMKEDPLRRKLCPKCAVRVEKISGCNHMTCMPCRSHFCWICLQIFASARETYDHLSRVHGGIGL